MIIKRIDPVSVAKITGIIAAVFGLIAGILFFAFGSWFGAHGSGMALGMMGGFMGIVVLPLAYGVFGFLGGLIHGFVYNVAAGFVGGIRIDTE